MTFTMPQTAQEFVIMAVPFITLLLGLAFLVVPGRVFHYMGLRPLADKPEAVGEGRSSFAGPLIAVALSCLLLQQPSLYFLLALSWTLAALGRIFQMLFDGAAMRKRIHLRFLIAAVLAGLAWYTTETPGFTCFEVGLVNCHAPVTLYEWAVLLVALLTLALGLIALLLPSIALRILRLESRIAHRFGRGEPRGTLAGFYTALGATVLLMPQPADFVVLTLAAAWLLTGAGRAISMIVDRGFTPYNVSGTLFELAIGAALLAMMFGYL